MQDYKKSVTNALNNFLIKQQRELEKLNGPHRKNSKPEKQVETECLLWMRSNNWSVEIYESKSKLVNGVWRNAGMKYGNADCQGTTDRGHAAFVEFKAPGKRASFNLEKNYRQQNYLKEKINAMAFACVVDSADLLRETYRSWLALHLVNAHEAMLYLVNALPRKKSP